MKHMVRLASFTWRTIVSPISTWFEALRSSKKALRNELTFNFWNNFWNDHSKFNFYLDSLFEALSFEHDRGTTSSTWLHHAIKLIFFIMIKWHVTAYIWSKHFRAYIYLMINTVAKVTKSSFSSFPVTFLWWCYESAQSSNWKHKISSCY